MIARLEKIEARRRGRRDQRARAPRGSCAGALWPVPPARSPAARQIAEWFGLPVHERPLRKRPVVNEEVVLPAAGRIMLVTGPSGAGKSALLRTLKRRRSGANIIDISRIRPRPIPCIDLFNDMDLAMDLLNRAGLGEAFTYMQLPRELSDGQRWRLRLALGIAQAMGCARAVLLADEFCAILDRVSAAVVARSLRRTIDRLNEGGQALSAVVATSHEDLEEALKPDLVVRCDFGLVKLEAPRAGAEARSIAPIRTRKSGTG